MMESKLLEILIKDKDRHYLIIENPDWDEKLNPALSEFGSVSGEHTINEATNMLRVLFETVYVMGYMRGKNDR